ncbi:unnamed protein product [Caenorhabditis brenneri]
MKRRAKRRAHPGESHLSRPGQRFPSGHGGSCLENPSSRARSFPYALQLSRSHKIVSILRIKIDNKEKEKNEMSTENRALKAANILLKASNDKLKKVTTTAKAERVQALRTQIAEKDKRIDELTEELRELLE